MQTVTRHCLSRPMCAVSIGRRKKKKKKKEEGNTQFRKFEKFEKKSETHVTFVR